MILVTSAYGNQGHLLLPKLVAAGLHVRASVQSEESAERVRALGASEVILGNIADPEVLTRAVDGVGAIYHVGPTAHPLEREIGFAIVDEARKQGVQHFVFSSVLHAITTDLVQHEIKRDVEEHLLSSGLEFTILQPSNYMLPLKLRPVFEEGVFQLSWALGRRQSLVDLGDVTDVAAKVLIEGERHYAATYELVSEGRYTAYDLGRIISGVLGHDIAVEEIDGDTYLRAFFGPELDDGGFSHQIKVFRAITARYSSHDFIGNPNVLRWLLGLEPTTFEQFVRDQYRQFVQATGRT
ncbi:MAG: NmrA family NAD(P)-binding protein [Deferrisomatales bacterium]|nr:NmrA family NAD(P)-binding protein [Deferrisomatales bacterium]